MEALGNESGINIQQSAVGVKLQLLKSYGHGVRRRIQICGHTTDGWARQKERKDEAEVGGQHQGRLGRGTVGRGEGLSGEERDCRARRGTVGGGETVGQGEGLSRD